MPIQFGCSACGQSIEVDDELAGQSVTCPFCRAVVMAGPVAGGPPPLAGVAAGAPPLMSPMTPPATGNGYATAALVCAGLVLLCFVVSMVAMMPVIQRVAPDGNWTGKEKQLVEALSKQPVLIAAPCVLMIAALAGVVCSVIGLMRRRGGRWQAITGLTICGLTLACQGLTVLLQLINKQAGGGS
ncbi:MAG: hypothetical protein U1A27_03210 [Phycisphaerae bacterium]